MSDPLPSEGPFRWALLGIFVLTMLVGGYHRYQAAKSAERISHREEGRLLFVSLRLAGLCVWLASITYLIQPAWVAWATFPCPIELRWFGAGLGFGFAGLMYWTLRSLGTNLTDTVVTRAHATLVTTGPYRWVRHPFYLSAAMLLLSATFLTANWLIGTSGLACLVLLAIRTPREERMLIDKFGDRYREYMRTTGRFWPTWKRS